MRWRTWRQALTAPRYNLSRAQHALKLRLRSVQFLVSGAPAKPVIRNKLAVTHQLELTSLGPSLPKARRSICILTGRPDDNRDFGALFFWAGIHQAVDLGNINLDILFCRVRHLDKKDPDSLKSACVLQQRYI